MLEWLHSFGDLGAVGIEGTSSYALTMCRVHAAARLGASIKNVAIAYAGNVDLAGATVGEIKAQGRRGLRGGIRAAPSIWT